MLLVAVLLILFVGSHSHETPFVIQVQVPSSVPQDCLALSQAQLPTLPDARRHPPLSRPLCPATTP